IPCSFAFFVLPLTILLLPFSSQAQSSMCAPVSNNPLVMANLCSAVPSGTSAPATERTIPANPARPPLILTVEQINRMVLDTAPLIHPGDFLVFEINRRDFVLHVLMSNGEGDHHATAYTKGC